MHPQLFFYVDAREGELPPSLATHPEKQQQHQESLVVYTEDWTDPLPAATYNLVRLRNLMMQST